MRRIKACGTLDTPRFRVSLLLLIADNTDKIDAADVMLANLRRVLITTECQADRISEDWRLPLA